MNEWTSEQYYAAAKEETHPGRAFMLQTIADFVRVDEELAQAAVAERVPVSVPARRVYSPAPAIGWMVQTALA